MHCVDDCALVKSSIPHTQLRRGKFPFPVSIKYSRANKAGVPTMCTETIFVDDKTYPTALLTFADHAASQKFYVQLEDGYHLFFYDPEKVRPCAN